MSGSLSGDLHIRQLPSWTIFKIGLICNLAIWGIIALILGSLAMFGYDTVSWNGQHLHGISALLISLMICSIVAALGAFVLMVGGFIGKRILRSASFGKLSYVVEKDDIGAFD